MNGNQADKEREGMNTKTWAILIGVAVAIFLTYRYSEPMINYAQAGEECVKFAEKNDLHIAFDPDPDDKQIFVAKKWISGTYVVVELGQKVAKKGSFQSRLCVLGDGQVQIPSAFEQWQFR